MWSSQVAVRAWVPDAAGRGAPLGKRLADAVAQRAIAALVRARMRVHVGASGASTNFNGMGGSEGETAAGGGGGGGPDDDNASGAGGGFEAAAALMKGGSGPISFTAKDARSWIAPDDEAVDYDKLRREMRLFPRFLFFASFGGVAGLRLAVREAVERTRHEEYPHSHISI